MKKMWTRWAAAALALAMMACLCACGNSAIPSAPVDPGANSTANSDDSGSGTEATYILRLAHEAAGSDHPYQAGAEEFARLVSEKTNGDVKIEVYGAASIGTQKETAEMCSMGTLDFALVLTSVLAPYDARWGVTMVPYLFQDMEHCWRVYDSEVGEEMYGWTDGSGLEVLSVYYNGIGHVETKKEVKTPDQMKGMKVRLQGGVCSEPIATALGMTSTAMAMSELYSALQLNTIDGIVQSINNTMTYNFQTVAPYYCMNYFWCFGEPLLASSQTMDSLPEEYQTAIREAAREAAVWQRAYAADFDAASLESLKDNGLIVYEPTEAEMEQWRTALAPVRDAFPEWKEIMDKIDSCRE